MRILFVTRKYPPSTGGMENAAFELNQALSANHNISLVKWGGANKMLPIVYPWLFIQALVAGLKDRPDAIYLQDGLMAPLGWLLRVLLRRPTLITIHGKEATYGNPLYKVIVPPFVKRQDEVVAVSNETRQMVEAAFPGLHPSVIYNGVSDSYHVPAARTENLVAIAHLTDIPLEQLRESRILYTNGRLVRRKGVLWFIDNVMPLLVAADPSVLYVVSGEGPDRELIETAIDHLQLHDHVLLLGRVSDEVRRLFYNAAHIFLMPNIPVPNDMEGFGLVALEAASCGTTVVASNLEGIPDAIHDGKNGFLVRAGDVGEYAKIIKRELHRRTLDAKDVRNYTLKHYSWTNTAHEYERVMQQLANRGLR